MKTKQAKALLEECAQRNMIQWNHELFAKSNPRLYKSIIEAINMALKQ